MPVTRAFRTASSELAPSASATPTWARRARARSTGGRRAQAVLESLCHWSSSMKLLPYAVLGALVLFCGPATADDDYSGHELAADLVTAALPLTSYAIAHYKEDGEG